MNFGQAIETLKVGEKVARAGWNGKGMWLNLVQAWDYYPGNKHSALGTEKLPWIGMKTADNKFVPWLASQTDMLADDWMIVGKEQADISFGKWRKKPVVIEALRYGIDPRPDWFQDKVTTNEIITGELLSNPGRPYCDIQTLEGTMRVNYGDYVIKGVQGEIYPCKPEIFEKTYEPA